jgi:hypothetical protein
VCGTQALFCFNQQSDDLNLRRLSNLPSNPSTFELHIQKMADPAVPGQAPQNEPDVPASRKRFVPLGTFNLYTILLVW